MSARSEARAPRLWHRAPVAAVPAAVEAPSSRPFQLPEAAMVSPTCPVPSADPVAFRFGPPVPPGQRVQVPPPSAVPPGLRRHRRLDQGPTDLRRGQAGEASAKILRPHQARAEEKAQPLAAKPNGGAFHEFRRPSRHRPPRRYNRQLVVSTLHQLLTRTWNREMPRISANARSS